MTEEQAKEMGRQIEAILKNQLFIMDALSRLMQPTEASRLDQRIGELQGKFEALWSTRAVLLP